MAEASASESMNDSDQDFDPSAEMLVNDLDDEQTLEEEEALESEDSASNELDDLQREGEMPLNQVLEMYGYESNVDNETAIKEVPKQESNSLLDTPQQKVESHVSSHSIANNPLNSSESDSLPEGQKFEGDLEFRHETSNTMDSEPLLRSVHQQSETSDTGTEDEYSPDDDYDNSQEEEYEYLKTVNNKYIKKTIRDCKFVYITKEEYEEGRNAKKDTK